MIELKKCSSDITTLFEEYLEELSKPKYNFYGGQGHWYDDWYDDDYYDDYYGDCYDGSGYGTLFRGMGCGATNSQKKKNTIGENAVIKKSTKRGKRGKGKKGKCIPLYDTDGQDLYDSDEVTIYFYRDINNPDDKEIFYNLYEFNEFLDSEGIYVSKYETKQLLNRSISHCCIDPSFASFKGEPWLISDSSFGGLSWTVCGDAEELLSQESILSNNTDDLPF